MKTFADREFEPHHVGGVSARVWFPNGYGVSVVRCPASLGWPDLYEAAVLSRDEDGAPRIEYGTSVTDDVLGYLTENLVSSVLAEVQALPKRGKKEG